MKTKIQFTVTNNKEFCQQLLMYVFRLGITAFILSDCLVSGLITGAACHIFTAQIKDFFGIRIPPVGAYFKIIKVSNSWNYALAKYNRRIFLLYLFPHVFLYHVSIYLGFHRDLQKLCILQLYYAVDIRYLLRNIVFQQ